jgi:hypothetical protein
MIRTGGGRFDPTEENVYFIASNTEMLRRAAQVNDHLLIAVNELGSENGREELGIWIEQGSKIFIDSGIFFLTNEHARKHDVPMDIALNLAPEEIDGFDELFNAYIQIVKTYGEDSWGYIELDQGGRDNKIRTRQRLHDLGLNPIPVYHPLNDGWDYFDYLAERYDRICFGNVVQADIYTRKRLVATAWERHRKYPNLWIHLLGLTPSNLLNAYPINSADSSGWLSSVRWSGLKATVDGQGFSQIHLNFRYLLGDSDSERGRKKANMLAAYDAAIIQRNWRNHIRALTDLGAEVYSQ